MRKVVHFIALLLFVLLPMQGRERGEPWHFSRALYEEYQSYKYDSAYAYAREMARLAAAAELPDARVEAGCATTFCLISAGLYKEAFDVMNALDVEGVSPATLLEYYKMQVRLNYSARGYSQTAPYWDEYRPRIGTSIPGWGRSTAGRSWRWSRWNRPSGGNTGRTT